MLKSIFCVNLTQIKLSTQYYAGFFASMSCATFISYSKISTVPKSYLGYLSLLFVNFRLFQGNLILNFYQMTFSNSKICYKFHQKKILNDCFELSGKNRKNITLRQYEISYFHWINRNTWVKMYSTCMVWQELIPPGTVTTIKTRTKTMKKCPIPSKPILSSA